MTNRYITIAALMLSLSGCNSASKPVAKQEPTRSLPEHASPAKEEHEHSHPSAPTPVAAPAPPPASAPAPAPASQPAAGPARAEPAPVSPPQAPPPPQTSTTSSQAPEPTKAAPEPKKPASTTTFNTTFTPPPHKPEAPDHKPNAPRFLSFRLEAGEVQAELPSCSDFSNVILEPTHVVVRLGEGNDAFCYVIDKALIPSLKNKRLLVGSVIQVGEDEFTVLVVGK